MAQRTIKPAEELETLLTALPAEAARELFDFAAFLHQRYALQPGRVPTGAILEALEDAGPLEFEEGELDTILDDIALMRQMDMGDSD